MQSNTVESSCEKLLGKVFSLCLAGEIGRNAHVLADKHDLKKKRDDVTYSNKLHWFASVNSEVTRSPLDFGRF